LTGVVKTGRKKLEEPRANQPVGGRVARFAPDEYCCTTNSKTLEKEGVGEPNRFLAKTEWGDGVRKEWVTAIKIRKKKRKKKKTIPAEAKRHMTMKGNLGRILFNPSEREPTRKHVHRKSNIQMGAEKSPRKENQSTRANWTGPNRKGKTPTS